MSNLPSFILSMLNNVPLLDESNYYVWTEGIRMFALSAEVDWLDDADDGTPAAVPADAEKIALDRRLVGLIYGRVSPAYQFLVADKKSGLAAWKALKAQFEKSTMARRIKARTEFDEVKHDPNQPIDIYIHAVEAARLALKGLGFAVDDTHVKDVILRNLDPAYDTVRTSILSSATEPTLENVKSTLSSSASAIFIKSEPVTFASVARAGVRGYGSAKKGAGFGNGGVNRGGAEGTPVDSKGYRWCDPSSAGCHRCGHNGHVAHLCIFDMPPDIKDWVMAKAQQEAHAAQDGEVHFAGAAEVDEDVFLIAEADEDFPEDRGFTSGEGYVIHHV